MIGPRPSRPLGELLAARVRFLLLAALTLAAIGVGAELVGAAEPYWHPFASY